MSSLRSEEGDTGQHKKVERSRATHWTAKPVNISGRTTDTLVGQINKQKNSEEMWGGVKVPENRILIITGRRLPLLKALVRTRQRWKQR